MRALLFLIFLVPALESSAQNKEKSACDTSILIRSSFCPNCDGINDVFLPVFKSQLPVTYMFTIFNRWGQEMYTSRDYREGWNGKTKDASAPEGTYFWVMEYSFASTEKQSCTGYVTLVR